MENTCQGKKCWFYLLIKELIGNNQTDLEFKNCPFYMEMVWTPVAVEGQSSSAKIIKDCSNKRNTLVLLEDIYPRLTGVQKSQEEMRNGSEKATEVFSNFLKLVSEKKTKQFIDIN